MAPEPRQSQIKDSGNSYSGKANLSHNSGNNSEIAMQNNFNPSRGRNNNNNMMNQKSQPGGQSNEYGKSAINESRNGGGYSNNFSAPSRDRQSAIGLRARTEQLEEENNSNRQGQSSSGKGMPDQNSRSSSHPASSAQPRIGGQNGGQNNQSFDNRAGGQRSMGGVGGGGGRYGGMNGGYGGMSGGYGGYGGGSMYGMGGMGMGMGMGMGSHMMMGPFSWIYSLNSIVHSIPMMLDVLGMNSQMLYNVYLETCALIMKIVNVVKRSDFRRFLQQKSRRSKALRTIFILVSMGLASQAVRLAKMIAENNFNLRPKLM